MNILVINCGSSSLKASVVNALSGRTIIDALGERLCTEGATATVGGRPCTLPAGADHKVAIQAILSCMQDAIEMPIDAVGHRVVHGGEAFVQPTLIDEDVEHAIEALIPHNPANLAGIRAARSELKNLPHVAVFDTAFHATIPRRAQLYALPETISDKYGVRRYGFHGISHDYVSRSAAQYLDTDVRDLRLITVHLGNGASVCAVEYGRSIETSMGMTPLEGLVMGTRCGDLDPGVLIHLLRTGDFDVDSLDELLNRHSGLAGISGVGNDMRDIEERAAEGDEACRRAMQVFAHRVRKYIGAYATVMGGVDAIAFAGGIGENSVAIRNRIAQRLDFLGARLDADANKDADVNGEKRVCDISESHSRTRLLVVATNEAHGIARATERLVKERHKVGDGTIPVAVSARHVHLTQEHVEALFGEGHTLTERNPLSQPGQFACDEVVTIVGPKREIEKVRVLGPTRSATQVEISRTDEFALGIDAPVRASGDTKNSPGILLRGPAGDVRLKQGLICAWRHIHMTPEDALRFNVSDRDVVDVAVQSNGRDLVFGDVLVRVKESYKLEMHIDTDEANAANLSRGATGALVGVNGEGRLQRRRVRYDQDGL